MTVSASPSKPEMFSNEGVEPLRIGLDPSSSGENGYGIPAPVGSPFFLYLALREHCVCVLPAGFCSQDRIQVRTRFNALLDQRVCGHHFPTIQVWYSSLDIPPSGDIRNAAPVVRNDLLLTPHFLQAFPKAPSPQVGAGGLCLGPVEGCFFFKFQRPHR